MIKYPKTQQFRNVIQNVKQSHDYKNGVGVKPYPVLLFEGSVKIHGTNGGIVYKKGQGVEFQSRERILSLVEDNAGFMQSMLSKNLDFLRPESHEYSESIAYFGEWCGGKIQKGVAMADVDQKIFVIFSIVVDGEQVTIPKDLHSPEQGIYNIYDFPTYELLIDFNNPVLVQNKIVDITNEIEKECPVGKHFGVSGVGEGVVFRCVTDKTIFFKSKGEKHSISKVKTLAEVDPEKVKNVSEFVEYAVTENRLNQGLEHFTLENKNIGPFLQWVVADIATEEHDVLTNSQLIVKDVSKAISAKARDFFFQKMNQNAGL